MGNRTGKKSKHEKTDEKSVKGGRKGVVSQQVGKGRHGFRVDGGGSGRVRSSHAGRRKFLSNAFKISSGLILYGALAGCDGFSCKNPIGPKKEDLTTILDVGYSDNKDNFKPDGYIDIIFSSNVDLKTLVPKNFPITGMGKTLYPKVDYQQVNNHTDQVRLHMPNLVPGRHDYRISVNNVRDAKGRLVDVDGDGKQGGSYQIALKTIEATKITSISNITNENVPIQNVSIYLRFNNPLDKSTLTLDNIIVSEINSGQNRVKDIKYQNNDLIMNLEDLKWFTEYELRVKKSVKDKWGFELNGKGDQYPPGEDFTYRFKTAQKPDLVPPAIESVNPVDGSLGVDVSTIVQVKFTEPIKHDNLEELLELRDNNSNKVQGSYEYCPNKNMINFRPVKKLKYNTQYKIQVKNIKDLFDNKMPDAEFNFTTEVPLSEQTPQKLEYLIAEKGDNLKETKLRFKVPADKSKTGSVEDGTKLSYIILRSEKPINNESDLSRAELIDNDYMPGLRTGEEVQLVIENPEAAKKYYYAVKVKDQDGNLSQLTSSNPVLSKGYLLKGKLVDALTKESYAAKIIVGDEREFNYEYDVGMKIDPEKIKNLFSTNQDGTFEIEVSSLTQDALLFTALDNQGDEGTRDVLVPAEFFKWKKENENIDNLVINTVDKTYNMDRWLKATIRSYYIEEGDPKAGILNTGYDSVMYKTKTINGREVRVINSTIVHDNLMRQHHGEQVIRNIYNKMAEVIEDASDGKYQLQPYDEARKINDDFGNYDNEIEKIDEIMDSNKSPYPGFIWFATQYKISNSSHGGADGGTIKKLYADHAGGLISYFSSYGGYYEECLTGLFNMPGETDDATWEFTIFFGAGVARPNEVRVSYRNMDFGAETYIGRIKYKISVGTMMRPKAFYYYPLVIRSGKKIRLPTYKGD